MKYWVVADIKKQTLSLYTWKNDYYYLTMKIKYYGGILKYKTQYMKLNSTCT